jgi:hypothetical protein
MYDAENVVALLNSHDELTVDHIVKTRKQSAFKQAEEPEPGPKERTLRVLKLAESRGITEAGIRIFEDTDSKKQRAATTIQGPMRKVLALKRLLKKRGGVCLSVLDFFKSFRDTCIAISFLNNADDDLDDAPRIP